ncbi:MAG: DASS family sodium-coupled anion symporter [Verrucomicrobiota bacterium]
MNAKQLVGIVLGIGALLVSPFLPLEGIGLSGQITLGIFVFASVFWIMEPIPIYATSMLVILLQVMLLSSEGFVFAARSAPVVNPILEVVEGREAFILPEEAVDDGSIYRRVSSKRFSEIEGVETLKAEGGSVWLASDQIAEGMAILSDAGHRSITGGAYSYSKFYGTLASPIIMLFLGGFALAASAVKFGLDRNLTRVLLRPFGTRPQFVCLGLMMCTGVLSAFMSNTATTAMMMTVVLPIVGSMAKDDPFRKAVALAIPVAANIGGIATPIGTPPNAVALAALKEAGISISFSSWMLMATPFSIVLLLIAWRLLLWMFKPKTEKFEIEMQCVFNKSPKAVISYLVFGGTVLMWITEKVHGISTSMVAFIPVAALPALGVLGKKDIRGFSWEVLWLVGGGISLGLSMKDTGLAAWLIGLVSWESFGGVWVIILFGLVGYALSNLISNTVTATMIMPLAITVGAGLAVSGDFNLVASIVAITVIVSCSMILPISTPPNAIAISSGAIETKDMSKVGITIGAIGFAISTVCAVTVWPLIIG